VIAKELQSETCKLLFDTTMRRALREDGLGAQVQQRKPFFSCRHVLIRLRFAQSMRIEPFDDWKRGFSVTRQRYIDSTQMVGHDVGLEMENALDLNMSIIP
jgi:hypothetical protein